MAPDTQVKAFKFPIRSSASYQVPAHWIPFTIETPPNSGQIYIWCYRNGE
jgi:hypothetical protein